jgi:hypothetical protein
MSNEPLGRSRGFLVPEIKQEHREKSQISEAYSALMNTPCPEKVKTPTI